MNKMNKTKECHKCCTEKDLTAFCKNKSTKDKLHTICKLCAKIAIGIYRKENKEKIKIQTKKWREQNKNYIIEYEKEYNLKNKEKISQRHKKYYKKNATKLKEYSKNWAETNSEKIADYNEKNKDKISLVRKQWREDNPDYIKKYYKENEEKIKHQRHEYYEENKEEINKKVKEYAKQHRNENNKRSLRRYHNDLVYKLTKNLRSRIFAVLKGNNKSKPTLKLLGCTVEELKQHLESQFTEGMTWDNYGIGGWEMDHIKPCAKFDLSKPEEQRKCFHYYNLQPLWAKDNRKKSDKYQLGVI